MSEQKLALIIWCVIMVALFTTLALSDVGENPLLEQCQKTHNVYQCELVAVPKEGG